MASHVASPLGHLPVRVAYLDEPEKLRTHFRWVSKSPSKSWEVPSLDKETRDLGAEDVTLLVEFFRASNALYKKVPRSSGERRQWKPIAQRARCLLEKLRKTGGACDDYGQ